MKFFMPCIAALFLASASFSQNCSGYYYLSNSSVVMTTYDKKANESGKVTSASLKQGSPFPDINAIALKRAMQVKFSAGTEVQTGTIQIKFENPKG